MKTNHLISIQAHLALHKKRIHKHMMKYLMGYRHEFGIYDFKILTKSLKIAINYITALSGKGKILFVTKHKLAGLYLERIASHYDHYYVFGKWTQGLLSNFQETRKRVTLLNKEKVRRKKRILHNTTGVHTMDSLPTAVVIIGMKGNYSAAREAQKCGLPVIAFVNSNEDCSKVLHCVPSNLNHQASLEFYALLIECCLEETKKGMKRVDDELHQTRGQFTASPEDSYH